MHPIRSRAWEQSNQRFQTLRKKIRKSQSKHTCENEYYRCGMKRHWSHNYYMSKLLVDLN